MQSLFGKNPLTLIRRAGILQSNYPLGRQSPVRQMASGDEKEDEDFTLPPPPDNCCMSNCPNCVWIEYAKELERMFHDGGATAKKLILQKMEDPSMRAFLSMELTLATKK